MNKGTARQDARVGRSEEARIGECGDRSEGTSLSRGEPCYRPIARVGDEVSDNIRLSFASLELERQQRRSDRNLGPFRSRERHRGSGKGRWPAPLPLL